jgi:hypothetical protein
VGRGFGFLFSTVGESAGNDAAAPFQRTGYKGCQISPPDLTVALAVVHAAQPKLFAKGVSEEGIWTERSKTNRPLREWFQKSRGKFGFDFQTEHY